MWKICQVTKYANITKKKLGSKNYCNYTKETLEVAIGEAKIIGTKAAHRKYSIPRGTLQSDIVGKHKKDVDRPTRWKSFPITIVFVLCEMKPYINFLLLCFWQINEDTKL